MCPVWRNLFYCINHNILDWFYKEWCIETDFVEKYCIKKLILRKKYVRSHRDKALELVIFKI